MAKPPPPRVVHLDVTVDNLDPRHDGVKIAHLSDIHVGNLTPRDHVRAAIDAANAAAPDIVALTGDYVCWRRQEADLVADQLAGLKAKRVFAVLGNHDYFTWSQGVTAGLQQCGYEVMKNASSTVDIGGAPLCIIGVDDPVTRHHDVRAAFDGAAHGTRVVLCHSPQLAPALASRGCDLVLSGHTHGGQLYVPGVVDMVLRRLGINYRRGMFEIDDRTSLYVTPGVGFSGVTRRFGEGTAAEVAVLTLRRKVAQAAA
jgi:uncharacterized protein